MEQKEHIEDDMVATLSDEEVYAEYVKKDITDDFIFGKVMQKKENCIGLLECLTGNKIGNVSTVISQKSVKVTGDSKGVRYDIYVEDDKGRIYDAEMQNCNRKTDVVALPKRGRFYQGMMDLNILESGADYRFLKENYVIFICTFDPFGRDLCCYEFENTCTYDNKLKFNDRRKILIFNTKGKIINVNDAAREFLQYVDTKKATGDFTRQIDKDVEMARQNREWMVEYMKTLVHDMDVRNAGKAEGIEIGLERGISQGISQSILDILNEYGEVPKSLKDRIYKEKDISVLKQWNRLSARVSTVEEFIKQM